MKQIAILGSTGSIGVNALRVIDEHPKEFKVAVLAARRNTELLFEQAKKSGATVLPIDSEHSGLWQCLQGRDAKTVRKLILTASGGPFFGKKVDFRKVTKQKALEHPKWKMGPKITIDSATMMNKGLEVIEAAHLFGVSPDRIEVLIHPEAMIHAMIEFVDGAQLAH